MTPDQRVILELGARYRLLTVEALARRQFEGLTISAARSAITRLLRAGLLCEALRLPERKLYQLTPKAVRALKVPPSVARPLQAQGIRRRYGILAYCCLGKTNRELLTPAEFAMEYPVLSGAAGIDPGQQDYLRVRVDGRIALAQVTIDNEAQRDSVVRKARKLLARAENSPVLAKMIDEKQFFIFILTAEMSKAAHIDDYLEHLEQEERSLFAAVRIEVVPQMLHIP